MGTMTTLIDGSTRRDFNTKETAQLIREALKAAFPGFKFSVTTKYASCYAATSIRWTDGPTEDEVELVTDKFTSQGFDGMTDCTTYHDQIFNGERVSFSGWVNVTRHISDELRARGERVAAMKGLDNAWPIIRAMRPNGCIVNVKR